MPGAWDDKRFIDARNRVVENALAHGKFAGTVGGLRDTEELIGLGFCFINLGADVLGIAAYGENLLDDFGRLGK